MVLGQAARVKGDALAGKGDFGPASPHVKSIRRGAISAAQPAVLSAGKVFNSSPLITVIAAPYLWQGGCAVLSP